MIPKPAQPESEYQCWTCKNKTCSFYDQRGYLTISSEDRPTGIRVSEMTPAEFSKRKGCASHSLFRSRPAPQQPEPFVAMSSTDLIALSEKEWTNRAERKQPEYNKRSWISGWMDGYFSKPQQPPATTPACPYSAEEDMCLECKAHEERIAAKARREEREQVIGELERLASEEEQLKKESKTNEPWMGHAYANSAYLKAIAILREGAK